MRLRSTGAAVGTVQATLPAAGPAAGPAEIAWVVARRAQGCGYAKEAARSLADRLLAAGWPVTAYIHPGHLASQHVARAAGLVPTTTARHGETCWTRLLAATP
jgi:RimJ/RimL family protein N-acetyltransferase